MKLWKTVLRLVYGDLHVQHTCICAYLLVSLGLLIVVFIDSTL